MAAASRQDPHEVRNIEATTLSGQLQNIIRDITTCLADVEYRCAVSEAQCKLYNDIFAAIESRKQRILEERRTKKRQEATTLANQQRNETLNGPQTSSNLEQEKANEAETSNSAISALDQALRRAREVREEMLVHQINQQLTLKAKKKSISGSTAKTSSKGVPLSASKASLNESTNKLKAKKALPLSASTAAHKVSRSRNNVPSTSGPLSSRKIPATKADRPTSSGSTKERAFLAESAQKPAMPEVEQEILSPEEMTVPFPKMPQKYQILKNEYTRRLEELHKGEEGSSNGRRQPRHENAQTFASLFQAKMQAAGDEKGNFLTAHEVTSLMRGYEILYDIVQDHFDHLESIDVDPESEDIEEIFAVWYKTNKILQVYNKLSEATAAALQKHAPPTLSEDARAYLEETLNTLLHTQDEDGSIPWYPSSIVATNAEKEIGSYWATKGGISSLSYNSSEQESVSALEDYATFITTVAKTSLLEHLQLDDSIQTALATLPKHAEDIMAQLSDSIINLDGRFRRSFKMTG